MNESEPSDDHLHMLRKYFGHNQFRPMQWKIIHSLLEKKQDNCVVMATGYGKSLCYQFPAVFTAGLSIVISPLISLMQDQVLSLKMSNIPACYLGSAQTMKGQTYKDILNGHCRVLYITPEWCAANNSESLLRKIQENVEITVIAIDEAHCVSQWGHDFRPAYRRLGKLREILPGVPILAVTATATPQVRLDICRSLNLRNAQVTCTTFDRPNLFLAVSLKGTNVFQDIEKLLIRGPGLTYKFPGPTIIYCPTKKKSEKVADELNAHGIRCAPYHADLPLKTRQSVHEEFVKDQIQVVVATVAFGMGIDKPDVRCVIHYGAPKEVESYYQEVGRAGRDGLPSICHAFYSTADFALQKFFIQSGSNNTKFREHREKMVRLMQQYLETRKCRRHMLLTYFDDINISKPKALNDKCCDNCAKQVNTGKSSDNRPEVDIVDDVKHLLKVVQMFGGRFGLVVPIKFIRGLSEPRIPKYFLQHDFYGSGKAITEAAWKALGRLCTREGLMREVPCTAAFTGRKHFPVNFVEITELGKQFIVMGEKCGVKLVATPEVESLFRKKKQLSITTHAPSTNLDQYKSSKVLNKEREQQAALFAVLRRLRDELARDHNCSPYMIASDPALLKIAIEKPFTELDLAQINGFNEAKIQKFGGQILNIVREFCAEKGDADAPTPTPFQDDEIFDVMTDDFFDKMQDISATTMSFKQYEVNEDDLANLDPLVEEPEQPTYGAEQPKQPVKPDENYWGNISDELFDSVPLDEIEQKAGASNVAKVENKTPPEDSKFNTKIQYDSDSETDFEDDHEQSSKPSVRKSPTIPPSNAQYLAARKRELPSWLIQPSAKDEIKKRVKSNSLFKK